MSIFVVKVILGTITPTSGDTEAANSFAGESEEWDLDSINTDQRLNTTPRDELVHFFIGFFLNTLLESWVENPTLKSKLDPYKQTSSNLSQESVEEEEDLGPCYNPSFISSTADYIKDLYEKRSSNLQKEGEIVTRKINKSLASNDFDFIKDDSSEISELKSLLGDDEVQLIFLNGVHYRGKVVRKLMEGNGLYCWEDGSTFKGEFKEGCATGYGKLEFPDLSVYEGGVYKSFRHGEGMHCLFDVPVMYSGQWWLGQKHGEGLIVYNDPAQGLNFYKGHWENGVKEGFGFRQYSSGAKYIGFWSRGRRHGTGVMLWSNHDIYRGQWKEGLMHGYGEYTWNGFINKSLSYPAANTYRGYWSEGKRSGHGIFEVLNGAIIETLWADNQKEGPGAVVCCNGFVVAAEQLFHKDKPALFNNKEDAIGLTLKNEGYCYTKKEENVDHLLNYVSSAEKAKAISIPIHSPAHSINLCPHTQKYYEERKNEMLRRMQSDTVFQIINAEDKTKISFWGDLSDNEQSQTHISEKDLSQIFNCSMLEEKYLRNSIICHISSLKAYYEYYSTLACEDTSSFKCVLLRMFLWQMLIDSNVTSFGLSLIDIDNILGKEEYLLIENRHNPFERIQFWQFIHILIILSWHLYGKHIFDEDPVLHDEKVTEFLEYHNNAEYKFVLRNSFIYFLEKNIFQNGFSCPHINDNKKKFEEGDLAPMEAMYLIYLKIGEPHSARDFLINICSPVYQEEQPTLIRYFEKLPYFKTEGKNALIVGGELCFISSPEPFNSPELWGFEKSIHTESKFSSKLTFFNFLKAKRIVKCLVQCCPGIIDENFIVNMDYQLTFLEFYKVIVASTELALKLKEMKTMKNDVIQKYMVEMEEYEKLLNDYEKIKELSSKKSKRLSVISKKGRK